MRRARGEADAARGAAVGLLHLLGAPGSGAGSPEQKPPARLAGAALSPPGGARGAGPAPLRAPPAPRPGPAHLQLRQTRARPLATPPGAANPRAGAGHRVLTLWLPGPCPRLGAAFTHSSLPGAPLLVACSFPRPLGSVPSLSNKSNGATPSLNPTFLATGREPTDLGKGLPMPSPESHSSPAQALRTRPPSGHLKP